MTTKRNILLTPGPATTSETVKQALVVPDVCPREREFGLLLEGVCRDLVRVVRGDDGTVSIPFGASGTGAVEAALTSAVPLGGKVLVVDNGAYGSRMVRIAEVFRIPHVRYALPYGTLPDASEVQRLLDAHRDLTHLALVHHETTTGMLNPAKEIAALARRRGLEVILDAISSLGCLPIDLREDAFDYVVGTANKCLQGMPGLAFVIVRREALVRLELHRRSFYLDLLAQHQSLAETLQTPFTPPVQIVYALRQALDEYFDETAEGRLARYRENWGLLYEGVTGLGFRPLLPLGHESRILSAFHEPTHPAYSFAGMHDFLAERGFTIYPGKVGHVGTFRLSVLGDLHAADIRAFLGALRAYTLETGLDSSCFGPAAPTSPKLESGSPR